MKSFIWSLPILSFGFLCHTPANSTTLGPMGGGSSSGKRFESDFAHASRKQAYNSPQQHCKKHSSLKEKKEEMNSPIALYNLGIEVFSKEHISDDEAKKSFNYFSESAKKKCGPALLMMGVINEEGFLGQKINYTLAGEYYSEAAEMGIESALEKFESLIEKLEEDESH